MFAEAKLYSDHSTCQQKKVKAMLTLYEDRLRWRIDETVLDVGCGPGILTSYLAKILPDEVSTIIGADNSSDMVSHSLNKYRNKSLNFCLMDITEKCKDDLRQFLPRSVRHSKFNKVFCFYVLHWLADKFQLALNNIENLLVKDGQGMTIDYISIPVFDTYPIIGKYPKWSKYLKGVILDYNPLRLCANPSAFMKKSLREAGLHVEDISQYSSHNFYKTQADLIGLLTSIDPFLQYIPQELHTEYQKDFLAILLPRCEISEKGTISIPFTIMTSLFTKM